MRLLFKNQMLWLIFCGIPLLSSIPMLSSNWLRREYQILRKPWLMQRRSVLIPVKWPLHTNFLLFQDLDLALKRACEELISNSSAQITLPLQSFLDQCTAFLSSPSGKDLPTQTWATAEVVLKLHADFQESLSGATRGVVGKLRVYLNDEKTIGVLLPPLLVSILGSSGIDHLYWSPMVRMRYWKHTRRSTIVSFFH